MLFNSIEFALFFPLVVALYFATPQRFRWTLLLAASYYFYASWKAEYLVLIVVSTVVDYGLAIQLGRTEGDRARKTLLGLSLATNFGVLFAFKYLNFFNDSARLLFERFDLLYDAPVFNLLLPVGISFYTFQTLSYTIDVYRRRIEPERHLGIFALYVSFFPQLVAGPIERASHLLPQFREPQGFRYWRVTSGLQLVLWGLFKKVVIADRIGIYVDRVYDNPAAYDAPPLILATYFFAIQIYCDFSGYSDMAIGSARVMGYDLMTNFRRPYFSKSIQEFWGRWHISLSTWFRDYLYIPLGGNRVPRWRWYANLFLVFLASGLWHGASWTFIVWGGLHGIFLVVALATKPVRDAAWARIERGAETASALARGLFLPVLHAAPGAAHVAVATVPDSLYLVSAPAWRSAAAGFAGRLPHPRVRSTLSDWFSAAGVRRLRRVVAVATTFHLVLLAWVFFRANSIADALTVLRRTASLDPTNLSINVALGRFELLVAFAAIAVLLGVHLIERQRTLGEILADRPLWLRWSVYYALLFSVLLLGKFGTAQFIYFQF